MIGVLLFSQLVGVCAPAEFMDDANWSARLLAIAKVESALNPLAIHDNTTGNGYEPRNRYEAERVASQLLHAGHSLDLGLMQINTANFSHEGLTIASSFDSCRSIRAGANILRKASERATRIALSIYNTGDPARGISNGYADRVEAARALLTTTVHLSGLAPIASATAYSASCGKTPPSWDGWAMAAHTQCVGNTSTTEILVK